MHNDIEQIIKNCSLNNIYLALVKTYSKLDAIKYIFSRFKHLGKLTLIMFVFLEITLIIKRVNNFFKF